MERLCKDCKHYRLSSPLTFHGSLSCHALDGKQHPVMGGDIDGIEPGLMRMTACGWEGRFWEKRHDATVE